jgi:hypothetical protein
MIAVGLAWFIVRRSDDTIYRSQLRTRADAPAQRLLIGMPVLANVPVRQAMAAPRLVIPGGTSVEAAQDQLAHERTHRSARRGRQRSVRRNDFPGEPGSEQRVATTAWSRFVDVTAPTVSDSAHLDVAVDAITTSTQHWVSVLDSERKVVGTVATSDVVRGYRLGLLASLQKMNADGDAAGADRVVIGAGSPLAGSPSTTRTCRSASSSPPSRETRISSYPPGARGSRRVMSSSCSVVVSRFG